MNKSAIYAAVKTSNLVVGIGIGSAVVKIGVHFGTGWAVASFIPALCMIICYAYLGDWILKKLNVPNY